MIRSFTLENFGPVQEIEANGLGKINLILAENAKGKTFILKALYGVMKSCEEAYKGENSRGFQEELRDKLHWLFQTEEISDLINKDNVSLNKCLKSDITLKNNQLISFSLEKKEKEEHQVKILNNLNSEAKWDANSIFLPPKEVFSLFNIIKRASYDKRFGFDATYIDLVVALEQENLPKKMLDVLDVLEHQLEQWRSIFNQPILSNLSNDKNKSELSELQGNVIELKEMLLPVSSIIDDNNHTGSNGKLGQRDFLKPIPIETKIKNIFDGSIDYDVEKREWLYKKGDNYFTMNATAEGIKKAFTLEKLLEKNFLNSNSIIFIDEPEANLHPKAVSQFLDYLFSLSQSGMQIFMATHSYFVIKKMYLLAKQNNESIPVLMFKEMDEEARWIQEDLKDGMPDNGIIDESIRLFEEETDWAMGYGQ